jgi:tetratricopeptide (TPR) repeat protein
MVKNYKIIDSDSYKYIVGDLSSNNNYNFYYRYNKKRKYSRKKFILLSTVIIFFILFFQFLSIEIHNTKLYKNFYYPYYAIDVTRSESSTDTLRILSQFINNKEYVVALNFIKKIPIDKYNVVTHFYLGVIYQETKDYRNAIEQYEIVIKDNDNLFIEQSKWYVGLCYMKINQNKKAIERFDELAQNSSFYKSNAEELLKILKNN